MPAIAADALTHRPVERGKRPVADTGFHIWGDIGAVQGSKRSFHRPPPGIG